MPEQNIIEWLNERCPEGQIAINQNGVLYLPIDTCERKLDDLTRFGVKWSTQNYKSNYFTHRGSLWLSASLELVLLGEFNKVLVGATTFDTAPYEPNTYFDAIAKSLCVVNAAHDLGDQFCRFLSVNQEQPTNKSVERKKPGIIEIKKYEQAIRENDQKTLEELITNYAFGIKEN